MCWRRTEHTKHGILDKDRVVYKIGYLGYNCFGSMFRAWRYYPRRINNKVELYLDQYDEISEGYHSYSKFQFVFDSKYEIQSWDNKINRLLKEIIVGNRIVGIDVHNNYYLGEFIIPSGSEYYENDFGELVSNNIIYTGKYLKL